MNREEAKQYIRNLINSSILTQDKYNNDTVDLFYNKNYLRALKLSKITGKHVNKHAFNGGELLFSFNIPNKNLYYFDVIGVYLDENYSNDYSEQIIIITDVINEYDEYKGYDVY